MLNEGHISIAPEDEKIIRTYLNDMEKYAAGIQFPIDTNSLTKLMQEASDKLKSNKFPFTILYLFSYDKTFGEFDANKQSIQINLFMHGKCRFDFSKRPQQILFYSLDFKKISITFIHEFIHFIQSVMRAEKSGNYKISKDWNDPKKYWKRSWEQQAYAISYLEKLKQELKIKKPEEILNQLRKMGVLHDSDLHKLKKTDYKSWKSIMKNAIMTTISDIEDGKPLPWQKTTKIP
jgi:hypothetical protein